MAKTYRITIPAHPNIYDGSERELELFFCEPDNGINEQTGLLLLTSGFGEDPASEDSERARTSFADQFNMVTVQCAYFGSRFMGTVLNPSFIINKEAARKVLSEEDWAQFYANDQIDMNALMSLSHKYALTLTGQEQLDESLSEFNDMGLMQALDNVAAYLTVLAIMEDNGHVPNAARMMAYGQGHGAYINHLCNALAPGLFATQVDHNSWMFPSYLEGSRVLNFQKDLIRYSVVVNYMAGQQPYDRELLYLPSLYRRFVNQCNLVCFEDAGSDSTPKQSFCKSVNNALFIESGGVKLASERIDNDYYKLFEYVMDNHKIENGSRKKYSLPNIQIDTPTYRYEVRYNDGLPKLQRISKVPV